jgi:general secretion pathway protein A
MYLKHFNLTERPFSITPDPRFLYMSDRHREALAHLLYGLGEGGGFVQLTGEVGTGKTTICRCLLEQVPGNVDVALVLNPKVTAVELIATVCDELGVAYPPETHSIKILTDVLNRHLLEAHARGRYTVLIIDEAQNLSLEALEQVRLLTNLETPTRKLLQIILIGQPELRELLAREEMRQLSQRVTARYHLEPIAQEDIGSYIQHRLQICGISHIVFNKRAVDLIRRLSGGIPRLINVLCDRALLGAYVEGKSQVDRDTAKKAAREVLAEEAELPADRRWMVPALVSLAGGLLAAAVYFLHPVQWLDIRTALFGGREDAPPTGAAPPAARPSLSRAPGDIKGPPDVSVIPPGTGESASRSSGLQPESSADELLAAADRASYRGAWTSLLALWSIVLPEEVKPDFCKFVYSNGMRCSFDTGTWADLRFYDRPVILKLATDTGEQLPVVLRRLDDALAELVIGDRSYNVPIEQLDHYWHGDYILLLRAPPGGSMYMNAGSSGPDVGWLREQLGRAQGVDMSAANPMYFDASLRQQVMDFQRSNGLAVDGVVGKNTIIQLNSRSGSPGIPKLTGNPS